jgi:hypothetical protein
MYMKKLPKQPERFPLYPILALSPYTDLHTVYGVLSNAKITGLQDHFHRRHAGPICDEKYNGQFGPDFFTHL